MIGTKMLDHFKELVVGAAKRADQDFTDGSRSNLSAANVAPGLSTRRKNRMAGGELLEYYQTRWNQFHATAETNAERAEAVDKTMCQIQSRVKKQSEIMAEMSALLSDLPRVINTVEQCNVQLIGLNEKFRACEDMLIALEAVIEKAEFKRRQEEHLFQLTMYKEKKLVALEASRASLATKQAENMRMLEQKQRQLSNEKRRAANELFENDLKQFKLEGKLPERVRAESKVSDATASLEEITLDDVDSSELDDFLNR